MPGTGEKPYAAPADDLYFIMQKKAFFSLNLYETTGNIGIWGIGCYETQCTLKTKDNNSNALFDNKPLRISLFSYTVQTSIFNSKK